MNPVFILIRDPVRERSHVPTQRRTQPRWAAATPFPSSARCSPSAAASRATSACATRTFRAFTAQLTFHDGYWYVRDLNSTNGIKVNGARVLEKLLHPSDEISIGRRRKFTIEYDFLPRDAPGRDRGDLLGTSLLEKAGLEKPKKPNEKGQKKRSTPPTSCWGTRTADPEVAGPLAARPLVRILFAPPRPSRYATTSVIDFRFPLHSVPRRREPARPAALHHLRRRTTMYRRIPPSRRVLAAAVILAALSAPRALAQPTPVTPQFSMLTVSLMYSGDKAVLDELRLSEEQAKKFTEHRKKWFADYFAVIAPERAAKGEEMSKANDKALADLFKPEQLRRLRKLTLQGVEMQYGGAVLRYPEVAEELKLSDEQKTKARTQEAPAVLTKDQLAKWEAMKGDAFKEPLTPDLTALFGDTGGIGGRFVPPPPVASDLAWPSVQEELALSGEQRKKVQKFRDEWEKFAVSPYMTEQRAGKAEELSKEMVSRRRGNAQAGTEEASEADRGAAADAL